MAATSDSSNDYSDFSQQTDCAQFQLVVEGQSLYVNAHMLAEASPVFAKICFGEGFKEKKDQKATIAEEKHKDILELLQCMLPSYPKNLYPKPITPANICQMIRLADKLQVPALATACERHIDDTCTAIDIYADVLCSHDEGQLLIDMLKASVAGNLPSATVEQLIACTALIEDETLLMTADVFNELPGPVLQRVMVAKMDETKKKHKEEMTQEMKERKREMAEEKKKHRKEMADTVKKHQRDMAAVVADAMAANAGHSPAKRKSPRGH